MVESWPSHSRIPREENERFCTTEGEVGVVVALLWAGFTIGVPVAKTGVCGGGFITQGGMRSSRRRSWVRSRAKSVRGFCLMVNMGGTGIAGAGNTLYVDVVAAIERGESTRDAAEFSLLSPRTSPVRVEMLRMLGGRGSVDVGVGTVVDGGSSRGNWSQNS